MKRRTLSLQTLILMISLFSYPLVQVKAVNPVVHAILFYSPTCPHCEKVITQDIPPLIDKYGDSLMIIGINTSVTKGQNLFLAAINKFQIPPERRGVPFLVVGDTVLVGELEIPKQLPGIIENGIETGGIDWPDIPGLREILSQDPSLSNEVSDTSETIAVDETLVEKYLRDPLGNSIAVVVLIGMLLSLILIGYIFWRSNRRLTPNWPEWSLPILAILGLFIAVYMSYVELSQSDAICGPVGDCNAVQQSSYARLFGVLPIGILGIIGYFLIFVFWLARQYGPKEWKRITNLGIWYMALFGILFSIYLTTLEPFFIGATCIWCLSSAIVITLILWISTDKALPIKQQSRIRNR